VLLKQELGDIFRKNDDILELWQSPHTQMNGVHQERAVTAIYLTRYAPNKEYSKSSSSTKIHCQPRGIKNHRGSKRQSQMDPGERIMAMFWIQIEGISN
jgi:hypothetical protein